MSKSERSSAEMILFLLRRIHIHPAYLLIPVTFSLLAAAFEGAGMGLLIPILNGFLNKSFSFATEIPILGTALSHLPDSFLANDRLIFVVFLGGFIGVYTLKNTLRFLANASMGYFSERSLHHLRKALFTKYLSFGKLFFDTTNVGHHSTLLLQFSQNALYPLASLDGFVGALFSLLVYLVVLLGISWKLTLVALPLFALLHFAIKFMITRIKRLSRSIAAEGSALGKKSIEILSTIPLVKSYQTERQEQERYTRISDQKAQHDFRVRVLLNTILPLQEIITLLVASAVMVGSFYVFGREQIASGPALLVYFYIIINASGKFGTVSGFRGVIANASGPMDAVLEIFDEEGKYFVRGGRTVCTGLKDTIAFRDLSFSYLAEREVLHGISFTVQRGKMTAIVGPTGGGKSTLISLLMRYYDCPPATLFVDGTDIRDFTLDSYLHRVALVSQETLLLHDTLRNNITYGLTDVAEERLQQVLKRARLADFIAQLPQGLETLIGDRGVKLSGGEKQRVSIARALLKDAEILILDEATSSLDSKTESLIQEAIDDAVTGRTSIVIAHRLSTIRHADKIVVLEEGRIAEEGALDDLLQKKGAFFALWEQQKF
ncbi:MAG: ABC transporter ATP-binding protein [Candidatus Peribacteraceae bacterium]|nr:ABC transporter ATP-binding protein [Candidatus Peribacteraceae bacterium]MDD5741899.1 ABC transporter ATP-binding protein [Candidatus Peribacteraceae bacterium]